MGCASGQKATTTQPTCADSFRNVLEDNHFPKRGRYKNSLVEDSANGKFYMYDACGAYVEIVTGGSGPTPTPHPVLSVNAKTGVVVINPDDLSDTSTTHKFTSAAEIAKLAGIEEGAEVNTVTSVNGKVGAIVIEESTKDVRDYGAVGDGVADDTESIQDAIDAAYNGGGGTVIIPPGEYLISEALELKAGVSIVGAGRAAVEIHQSSETEAGIVLVSTGEVVASLSLSGFTLSGPNAGSEDGIHIAGVPLDYVAIEDVSAIEWGGTGIHLEGAIVSRLLGVIGVSNGVHGIRLNGTDSFTTSVTLVNCYGNNNGQVGIYINKATYMSLNGCAADNNDIGYYLLSAFGTAVNGCGAEVNTTANFKVEGDETFGSASVSLNGCYSYGAVDIGFLITGFALGVNLFACQDNEPGSGASYSLQVDADAVVSEASCKWSEAVNILGTRTVLAGETGASSFLDTTITGDLVKNSNPPATAAAAGVAGQIEWDASYIYICTATDTWKRAAIATW